MIAPRARATLLLLAAACAPVRAQLYPAASPGLLPRDAAVVQEGGRPRGLMELVRGSGPVVLLPIFTQCAGTCPLQAGRLKAALARTPQAALRVVVFSFDASDTDADLNAFRRAHSLPDGWVLARAANAGAAREFLDQFGYKVMQSGPGFVHPSEALVLSGAGRWSGTFAGADYPAEALLTAARQAAEMDSPGLSSGLRRALLRPQVWVGLALAALVLVAAGSVILSVRISAASKV